MKLYLYFEDLGDGLVGPFTTMDQIAKHREFCRARGDADSFGRVVYRPSSEFDYLVNNGTDIVTPAQDRRTL